MELASSQNVFDQERVRADFPILEREVRPGVRLVYLDSAATSQKPRQVIEAVSQFLSQKNANIHRGIHTLAEEATAAYESARSRLAEFIGAGSPNEVVFTRNATESINLVAHSWARPNLSAGDVILLSEMEHHANLVPWQMLADERRIRLEFIPVTDDGRLDLGAFQQLLELKPKLVAVTHMSNVLGTINPVAEIAAQARQAGARVLVDAAQSIPHLPLSVGELGADFLAFSAHKMLGPTGVGALWARLELLESMPPFLGGGDMIKRVHLRSFVPNDPPHKFEAGTPAIAEAVGFGAAVDYLSNLGMEAVKSHEQAIIAYALERLEEVPGLRIYGPPADGRGGVAAFTFGAAHPHDVAQILDRVGVAVRAGHHCAMPIHEKFGIAATTRASFYIYNTTQDVDQLIEGLYQVHSIFT
jgi:cysteine desulfurase / selenocysteine lyase